MILHWWKEAGRECRVYSERLVEQGQDRRMGLGRDEWREVTDYIGRSPPGGNR